MYSNKQTFLQLVTTMGINEVKNHKAIIFLLSKKELFWTAIVVGLIISLPFYDWSWLITEKLKSNLPVIITLLTFLIGVFIVWFVVRSVIGKRYSLKIEKLTFGGMNILFNTTSSLYINSVVSFLDTKRSLFIIRDEYDNFSEVLDSYYQTYSFFRQEMKILDPNRDKELYDFTNELLMVVNKFLTKYQNNYRRWYKYTSETKEPLPIENGKENFFYNTPIGTVQKLYYDYENITKGFEIVNLFFSDNVKKIFDINVDKWDW